MHPVKLLARAAGTTTHVLRHPIASAAYAAGLVRGLAGAAVHGVTVTGHDPDAGRAPAPPADGGVPEPQRIAKPVPEPGAAPDPIVVEPEPAGEAFATEPKATSRESAHGRSGADEEIDQWSDEATDGGEILDLPEDAAEHGDTETLLDPATAKAVRSEAAMMQRAADPDTE
jgi:hypothetical protein